MKKLFKITVFLFTGLLLLNSFSTASASWAEGGDATLKQAQELNKLEKEYFNKRLKNDLRGAYEFQHPEYKKQVSVEEFLYFEGRVLAGYRDGVLGHISGGMIPKIKNCLDVASNGVKGVCIIDGRLNHSILFELLSDKGSGTLIRL